EELLRHLAWDTVPRRSRSSRSRAKLDLKNVFVEFSPLEIPVPPSREEYVVPRALWLLRSGEDMWVASYSDLCLAGHRLEPLAFGPYSVSLDAAGDLLLDALRGTTREGEEAWTKELLRPVLLMLRDLSPGEKTNAYKAGIVGGGSVVRFTPSVDRQAELVAGGEHAGIRYYLPKKVGTNEAYIGDY
ncbi:MAG TPA: hypothetical protein VKU85_17820, partial [bacterium]|nr:hypothetical protein [bacterium]